MLISSLLLLTTVSAFANNCAEIHGAHQIQVEGRSIHVDYFDSGTVSINDQKGWEAFYLNTYQAGGISGNKTYAPLVWKPLMGVKDGVDATQDWFHGADNYRDIQLFRKEDHPGFYKSIAKKFLKKIDTIEADDDRSKLILECVQIRLKEILE